MGLHYHDIKKQIILKILNFSFDVHMNEHALTSVIPNNIKIWVTSQLEYTDKTNETLEYELLMLLVNYSMKMFNYVLDKSKILDKDIDKINNNWNKINIDPLKSIHKIINYINKSPKCNINMEVYSGISYDDFQRFNVIPYYINNRFLSTTFDKLHALKYSYRRRINKMPLFLLKINIKSNTPCIYTIYENQIVLPPNIKIKLIDSYIEHSHYKDILDTKLSKKIYIVNVINSEISL
jgi:hypothetical protein